MSNSIESTQLESSIVDFGPDPTAQKLEPSTEPAEMYETPGKKGGYAKRLANVKSGQKGIGKS